MNSISPSSEEREIAGHRLTWHRWHPEGIDFKAALFFLHGQGDYGERYQEVAEFFLGEGIAFATCDLPGHGRTAGKRGHIPSWELVKEVSDAGMAEARALVPHKPVGFGGHSVGGLLALFLLGELEDKPDFSWISSPLLKPEAGQPHWKYRLLGPLSHLLPSLTLSTGVSPSMCREDFEEELSNSEHQFHSRISLSWGRTLIELAEVVGTQPERLPSPLPIILTQGKSDPICPPQYCEELAHRLQRDDLKLILYPETRHEPFADKCRDKVFDDLRDWLSKTI
ncbi:MAG: alpha/beta fold hydrolase [Roseibacillus sp.]